MSVHGSPVISFPAHELADLKARLAAGHTISSAHPQGKHKAGDILMSSLGMLRVLGVKPVAPHELTAHSGATKAHVAGGQADMLELKKLGEAAVTDTPALDILAATKQAGLADIGRNALMAGAIGSAGVAGGMGGHALGHNIGTHLDPSNPSPAWHAPARQQMAAETHPANTLGMLGGLGGAGGGAGAAALALLAARRRGVPLGAGPVA